MNEKYVDGNVCAMVRMMGKGGCLPVWGNTRMSWKHDMNNVCVVKWNQRNMCC